MTSVSSFTLPDYKATWHLVPLIDVSSRSQVVYP